MPTFWRFAAPIATAHADADGEQQIQAIAATYADGFEADARTSKR